MKTFTEWRNSVNNVAYHVTNNKNAEIILKEGLNINKPPLKSMASLDYIKEIYGITPIFLSFDLDKLKSDYFDKEDIILIVDVSNLELVADVPTLTDYGAMYDERGESIYWEDYSLVPDPLQGYVDEEDCELYYSDLLDPYSSVCRKVIEFTKCFAVMANIEKERIKVTH